VAIGAGDGGAEFEEFTKMIKSLFIPAAAVLALATQAPAQTTPPVAAQPQANLRGNWLQADMTRQKAQQMADGLFQQLDLNHDGTLTRTEAEQARSAIGGGGGGGGGGGDRATRMIARVFGDAQAMTLAQFDAQALARFDRQDLNHDGTVTADERQQARAARQQPGQ
jgi:hypothetical protein